MAPRSCRCEGSRGWPLIGKAEFDDRLSDPVSAAWLGGRDSWTCELSDGFSSISSPEKEKLNADIPSLVRVVCWVEE